MSHSFSASNKLTEVLNNASTTLAVRLDTSLPQLQPSGYIQIQFPQRDITKFLTHDSIGSRGAGTLDTAHGYISIDDQIMWFDGITNIGGLGQFKVYKRRINLSSVISHVYNSPIQMRVTRQHFLQMQGFLSSISRAFSTSGNAIVDLSNSSYGLQYVGSQYNVGNIMWNGMTATIQNLGTQWEDNGASLFPRGNKSITASRISISGNTTVDSLSRTSLSILGLRKDLKWDDGYNTINSYSAGWMSTSAIVFSNSRRWSSSLTSNYLKNDGSVPLTANWDVDGANTLYIDKINSYVGFGTNVPAVAVEISKTSAPGGEVELLRLNNSQGSGSAQTISLTFLNAYTNRGSIKVKNYTGPAESEMQLWNLYNNDPYLAMTLKAKNVGIGISSPTSKLHAVIANGVQNNSSPVLTVENQDITAGQSFGLLVKCMSQSSSDKSFQVINGSSAALVVLGNGYVGIGTSAASGSLHVVGNVFMPSLKSGTAQADAGAAAGELWINTSYS